MKKRSAFLALAIAGALASGCARTGEGDTSPLPPQDPQTRADNSRKAIESSNMTPEQKQAALDYVSRSASDAQRMQSSMRDRRQGAPK